HWQARPLECAWARLLRHSRAVRQGRMGCGDYSDQIAERAGALGGVARGTFQTAVERSFLTTYPLDMPARRNMSSPYPRR
ncbi:hypothetical protein K9U41_15640, partial [Xanthobacter autotrophicus]|nr:hypothetical protein [Xanthobacter autotrophicus]